MSTGLNLYEITEDLLRLEDALIESDGVITDEMAEEFDELLDAEEDKTEGYIAVIRSLEEGAAAAEREKKRLKKLQKTRENAAERLKERLLLSMEARGQEERITDLGKAKRQQNSSSGTTVFTDPKDLPKEWRRESVRPDKRAIREALESEDAELRARAEEHAQIDERGFHLRIY